MGLQAHALEWPCGLTTRGFHNHREDQESHNFHEYINLFSKCLCLASSCDSYRVFSVFLWHEREKRGFIWRQIF